MRRALVVAVSLALAAVALAPAGAGAAGPVRPGHRGRWITDEAGRVLILQGVNMANKLSPYTPASLGFGDDDAAFLAAEGFDTVRLGVIYKALEPTRGTYDETYLDSIASTIHTLGAHGLRVLVDFHQDLFNERFNGEGFPDWAVIDDGLPAQPDGGFPANYFVMPALWRAFQHLWENAPAPDGTPLWDAYGAAWAHVVTRLRGEPAVLGYDLFNEPWPGATWPSCLPPLGCPLFDAMLTDFYSRVIEHVRAADPDSLVFYETHPIYGPGAGVYIGNVDDAGRAGFSFHVYCLSALGFPSEVMGSANCPLGEDRPYEVADAHSVATGSALLLTEFGATDDLGVVSQNVATADRHMVGWQYWAYWNRDPCCERPAEGIIRDPAQPPAGDNLKTEKLAVLVRPHPRAVAGTPLSYAFHPERADRLFQLSYLPDPSIALPTEVVVPARQYPSGYSVSVSGATVTSAPGAPVLTLVAGGAGEVHVSITG